MNGRASLPARAALAAIRFYQRRISPHKGFDCALRHVTGADGCSAYGHAVIARFGLWRGLRLLRRRFDLCGCAHRRLARCASLRAPAVPRPPLARQGGFCDLPGDGVLDALGCAADLVDCMSCCRSRAHDDVAGGDARLDGLSERVRRRREHARGGQP